MKSVEIAPGRKFRDRCEVPGDKSIGHRAALIGAISDGVSVVENYPRGADCLSSLACIEALGAPVHWDGDSVRIGGLGLGGLKAPTGPLDAGNSGTTVRLLSGILAGHAFSAALTGDASLSRRPMGRIVTPLEQFGARVSTDDGHLPMSIHGGSLHGIDYALPVPSAQVKSAVLLAGLHARGPTTVREPLRTRNHTEVALAACGAAIRVEVAGSGGPSAPSTIVIDGSRRPAARQFRVPGDVSSAAFLIAAALLMPDSELTIERVGVNPSRIDFLDLLVRAGADIELRNRKDEGGEPAADIHIRGSRLEAIDVSGDAAAGLIDELPILAVLGVCGPGRVSIRGAAELRHKETDRIRALSVNLEAIGARVEEFDDGLAAERPRTIPGGNVDSFDDHRIAMAFAVAGLASANGVRIKRPECAGVSFPGFYELLGRIVS